VVRGGRKGVALAGNARFYESAGIPGRQTPGRGVGWSVAVLDLSGDHILDVAVALRAADSVHDSVYVINGGKGAFAPLETRIWRPLRGTVDLESPRSDRIRLARSEGY
jgi:hypothetical protein